MTASPEKAQQLDRTPLFPPFQELRNLISEWAQHVQIRRAIQRPNFKIITLDFLMIGALILNVP
jgi:hypothetical protein